MNNTDNRKSHYLFVMALSVVAIIFSLLLATNVVYAAASGECGTNAQWTLDNEGLLTIKSTGVSIAKMDDYPDGDTPWYSYRNKIKRVKIEQISNIGILAFCDCSSLTSITIPDSVTSIGECAFSRCSSLTSITIPEGVTSIGNEAFSQCSSLTSITIPDSVTSIGRSAFCNCSSLESITIPDSVTSIGSWAFCGCSGLTSITIPGEVISIQPSTFEGCTSLTRITIQDGVIGIGEMAFYGCRRLTSITIPESITGIDNMAFAYCSALKSIEIPNSVKDIMYSAFYGCSSLTSITIPKGIKSIEESTFSGCSSLTSITIPNSVTSIGNGAFRGCSSLTSITIPESVANIGGSAFSECSKLKSINIPESVKSIGNETFSGCSSLTSIYIIKNSYADYWLGNDSRKKYYETIVDGHYVYHYIKKATIKKDGQAGEKCIACGKIIRKEVISHPKAFTISKKAYTYNGKAKKPTVTIRDGKGKLLKKGTNYIVKYASGRYKVGKYKVTVKMKGKYSGTKCLSFKINPKGTTLDMVTPTSKGFKVTWKKQAKQITGYEIKYCMSSNTESTSTIVKVSNTGKTSKSISNLKAKKKYYVIIRTYKMVNGKKYCSAWSKKKYVTTKA